MSDNDIDIDDLMCWLSRPPRHDWDERPAEQDRYYLALAALVAERDALRAELAAAKRRIEELEAPIRNPLSRALELEQALAAMRKENENA
jgi:hypothetical protein